MSKAFSGMKARNYRFEDGENTRDVIQIYVGGKRAGFMEYDTARKFVDTIHDLADAHDTRQRGIQNDT